MTSRLEIYWDELPHNSGWAFSYRDEDGEEHDPIDNLDDLLRALRLGGTVTVIDKLGLGHGIDELPAFGGSAPDDTAGVWSWDEDRVLVGSCADDYRIVPRPANARNDPPKSEPTVRICIDASAINYAIRREWKASGGVRETLAVGHDCVSGLDDEQILAIASCAAELRGNTTKGVSFHRLEVE